MKQIFPMARPSAPARVTMTVLTAFITGLAAILAVVVPPPARYITLLVMGSSVLLLLGVATRMDKIEFEVDANELYVHGDLFSRRIPRSAIRTDEVRRLSGDDYRTYEPVIKTCGTGLPGYLSGWFRLRNREKAFIFVTDSKRAVYIPASIGYSLLLTPEDPDGFIAALRS
jgi:hypothetical protein